MERLAVIVFGHGSRDPLWRQPMDAVAGRVQTARPGTHVGCAFLELQPPDLPTAVAQAVQAGVTEVRILPMFLGAGRHARGDLGALVAACQAAHPALRITVLPPAGEDPRVLDLLANIALE